MVLFGEVVVGLGLEEFEMDVAVELSAALDVKRAVSGAALPVLGADGFEIKAVVVPFDTMEDVEVTEPVETTAPEDVLCKEVAASVLDELNKEISVELAETLAGLLGLGILPSVALVILILEEAALGEDVELLDSLDVLLLEAELADLELDTEDSSELPVAEASTNELVIFPTPLGTPLLSEVVVTKPEEVVVLRSTLVTLVLAAPVADPPLENPVVLPDALARPVLGAFVPVTVFEELVVFANAMEKPVLGAAVVVVRTPEELVVLPLSD